MITNSRYTYPTDDVLGKQEFIEAGLVNKFAQEYMTKIK